MQPENSISQDQDTRRLFLLAWVILCVCAAFRHAVFCSSAFDLGIFDQALWQLSHDKGAYSSLMSMNIFSDHGAFILYPISFVYRVVASPYVLFGLQSLALSLGVYALAVLGRCEGLTRAQQLLAATVYILHPVVFNTNLFDFHPETLGVPLIPLLFVCAQQRRYTVLAVVCVAIMSCKEVLALTTAGVGVVLILQGFRVVGAIMSAASISWFVLLTLVIMPGLPGGADPNAFARYDYLGSSLGDKVTTLLLSPSVALSRVDITQGVVYGLALATPCFWIFNRHTLTLLAAIVPAFILNVISTLDFQRSLRFQYSLPLIPLFGVMAVVTLKRKGLPNWLSIRAACAWAWVVAASLIIGRNVYSFGTYPVRWFPHGAVAPLYHAVDLVPSEASVLASGRILPHLAHRVGLGLVSGPDRQVQPTQYDYVVLDPTGSADPHENDLNGAVVSALRGNSGYEVLFEQPEVIVFRRR